MLSNDRDTRLDEFATLMKTAVLELGIAEESISNLKSINVIKYDSRPSNIWSAVVLVSTIFLSLILLPAIFYTTMIRQSQVTQKILDTYLEMMYETNTVDEICLVQMSETLQDPFRPPVDCNECVNVTKVHRVQNLSHSEFMEKYAFTMQPVVIEDGQYDWDAGKTFSFDFFKQLYSEKSEALETVTRHCLFFPYSTEFNNLGEMFNMSIDRAQGKKKPWYVGWSNCVGKETNTLRKHYKFPYFLPPELDHSKIDWVFMGLPGYGAHMHIDAVNALSWQAQVTGIKKWILESPPECSGICIRSMEVIVNPGDIIVLDTNKWFHATLILGNKTSITIGSEYF